MIKDKRFISNSQIEERANKLLAGYGDRYGKILKHPIPLDQIIEAYLELKIEWDEIDDSQEGEILGCLDSHNKTIQLNTKHLDHFENYLGTEAYTKAHEVGHWDLHIAKDGEVSQLMFPSMAVHTEKHLCRQNSGDSREIQAEKFASYLLMPHYLLMPAILGVDLTSWSSLYSLKDEFGVTVTAMKNRLVGLGLVFVSDKIIYRSTNEFYGGTSFTT